MVLPTRASTSSPAGVQCFYRSGSIYVIEDPCAEFQARSALAGRLSHAVQSAQEQGEALSLLVVDIDYFKSVNDAFGHQRGDEVLEEFAERLRQSLRAGDEVFRYGGDEFVVLLRGIEHRGAAQLARRLLESIQSQPFSGNPCIELSLSIGMAGAPVDAMNAEVLFATADARLREAKRRGRAQVVSEGDVIRGRPGRGPCSRLIEREDAIQALHHLLESAPQVGRAVLAVRGESGSGRSRFLAEAEHAGRMLGYEVLHLCAEDGADPLAGAMCGMLEEWSRGKALILIDDLDDQSRRTLAGICASLQEGDSDRTVAVVYATRPDAPPPNLPDRTFRSHVNLQPLSARGVRALLRHSLHWEPPSDMVESLLNATGGYPRRVSELLDAWISGGQMARSATGGWEWTPPAPAPAPAQEPAAAAEETAARLPVPSSPIVGREGDIEEISALLGQHRLLTLLGPGGIGKTRLALAAARRFAAHRGEPAYFIPLAGLSDPALLLGAIASHLGLRDAPDRPIFDVVTGRLRDHDALLVLDNLEQMVAAGPELSQLLGECARLRILITSRASLRIYGEHTYRVQPLALPDRRSPHTHVDRTRQSSAVQLFTQRAASVDPAFTLTDENAGVVSEICWRVDGLPLALELAAAKIRQLGPEAILSRLGDRLEFLRSGSHELPTRQRTLRGAIDWSHDLLTPAQRYVFACLSVFVGGSCPEMVEAVVPRAHPDQGHAREISALIEQSLVGREETPGGTRLTMLDTLRDYAAERLEATGQAESLRHAHGAAYLCLAEGTTAAIRGPDQVRWLARLELELGNFRAALSCFQERGMQQELQRLAGALWRFWFIRGHIREGRLWLRLALEEGAAEPSAALAQALYGAGVLAMCQGDYDVSSEYLRRLLAVEEERGDRVGISSALLNLGNVANARGMHAEAIPFYADSLAIERELDRPIGIAGALNNLGEVSSKLGRWEAAAAFHAESLQVRERIGDLHGIAESLHNLGEVALDRGDLDRARALRRRALRIMHQVDDKLYLAANLKGMAHVEHRSGRSARAVQLFGAAVALLERHLGPGSGLYTRERERLTEWEQAIGYNAYREAWDRGAQMGLAAAVEFALQV